MTQLKKKNILKHLKLNYLLNLLEGKAKKINYRIQRYYIKLIKKSFWTLKIEYRNKRQRKISMIYLSSTENFCEKKTYWFNECKTILEKKLEIINKKKKLYKICLRRYYREKKLYKD